jgi:hypothetical protein
MIKATITPNLYFDYSSPDTGMFENASPETGVPLGPFLAPAEAGL